MSSGNWKRYRNVHVHHSDSGDCFRGMFQCGSLTEAVFPWILTDVLFVAEAGDIQVKARASQRIMSPTNNALQPGDYDVYGGDTYEPGAHELQKYLIL